MKERDPLTGAVIGAAIEVHRALGPGLLEKAYRDCLMHELRLRDVECASEVPLDLSYKGMRVPGAYRVDLLVARRLVVEVKAVEEVLPVHRSQVLTYQRLLRVPIGLLLNFHVPVMKEGVFRLIDDGRR